MTKRVLVTGATGRTGSLVLKKLRQQSDQFQAIGLARSHSKVKELFGSTEGFVIGDIKDQCERREVKYAFGFSSNTVLKRKISYLLDQARLQYISTGEKARLFDDVYYAAGSWDEPRRVIMKAEWLECMS